ncbi:MAG: AlbA family DNA-binding domain-containing protein [Inquilinaceae bacterium]
MVFSKRLVDLKPADIERLIIDQVQESAELELKRELPRKDAKKKGPKCVPDAKDDGESDGSISDYARDKLLAEIIAFANAHGGVLVIGIEETNDKPPRAKRIYPISHCADRASRLHQQCQEKIDPPIPLIETQGVPFEDDGSGVVVVRVPRSRLAPHRHKGDKECYVRRSDRSEPMDMREIQDLTLQVERGLGAVETAFVRYRDRFDRDLRGIAGSSMPTVGLRATAIPLSAIEIERVYNNPDIWLPAGSIPMRAKDVNKPVVAFQMGGTFVTPLIRGMRLDDQGCRSGVGDSREVYTNGVIEYRFWIQESLVKGRQDQSFYIDRDWVFGLFLNTVAAADHFRIVAGAPELEYGIEFEIAIVNNEVPLRVQYGRFNLGGGSYNRTTVFPRYSIGSRVEFPRLSRAFQRDFWNGAAIDPTNTIDFDFDEFLGK